MQKIKMKMEKDTTIRQGYGEFIRRCKVKNYSPYTIKYYDNNINVFGLFCDLDSPIKLIDEDLVNQYVLHLQEQKIKEYTVSSYMKAIRAVLYFFMQKDYIEDFKITIPKADRELKQIYTDTELKILLKKPKRLLCHSDISTTKEYLNLLIDDLQQDYDSLNPHESFYRNNKKIKIRKK